MQITEKYSLRCCWRGRGSIDGKLLTIVLVLMVLSVVLMAWFSQPQDTASTTAIDGSQQDSTGVVSDRSGVE